MNIKNPQLKIQILAGIIALLLVVPIMYDMVYGFVLGFNSASAETVGYEAYPTGFEVIPTDSEFVESVNTNVGTLGFTDFKRELVLFLPAQHTSPAVNIISTITSVAAVLLTIYYIIAVFKMISTVMRQGIMSQAALGRLRKVSYTMLAVYILFTLSSCIPTWYYSKHILLDGYTLAYPRISEGFVIAFIFILLTEILNIALRLKEEQDLTI